MARSAESNEFAYGLRVVKVITRRRLRQLWRRLLGLIATLRRNPTLRRAGAGLLGLAARVPGLNKLVSPSAEADIPNTAHPGEEAIEAFKTSRARTPPPQRYTLGEDPAHGRGRVQGKSRELRRQVVDGLAAERSPFRGKKDRR